MSDNSKPNSLPGSVSCIFCNTSINFLDEGKEKFFNHLRDEHLIFLNHNVVLAINFLDKDTLQVIVQQFETSYFRIMETENKKAQVEKVEKAKKVGKGKKVKKTNTVEKPRIVDKMKKVEAVKKNGKINQLGKIKIIDEMLLQEPVVNVDKIIFVEDDEPVKEKVVYKKKPKDTKKPQLIKKSNSLIKTHLNSVQRRKSISTAPSKKDIKSLSQVRRHSIAGFKQTKRLNGSFSSKPLPTKRLNGSFSNKPLPRGLNIVKALSKNKKDGENSDILSGLAGITITKADSPKPQKHSKVINLTTDNINQIKKIAQISEPGFSCDICNKKFNTNERFKKHSANCVRSTPMNIPKKKAGPPKKLLKNLLNPKLKLF